VHLGFFLPKADQQKLIDAVKAGATLIAGGELPAFDENMKPCTLLADFITNPGETKGRVFYSTGNIFNDERAFLGNLTLAGWEKRVDYDDGLKVFVYRHEADYYLFFFNFDRHGSHDKTVTFYGHRLDLTVGSKTCGIVHVNAPKDGKGRLVSYLVKGVNEYEMETAEVVLKFEDQKHIIHGDNSGYDL